MKRPETPPGLMSPYDYESFNQPRECIRYLERLEAYCDHLEKESSQLKATNEILISASSSTGSIIKRKEKEIRELERENRTLDAAQPLIYQYEEPDPETLRKAKKYDELMEEFAHNWLDKHKPLRTNHE